MDDNAKFLAGMAAFYNTTSSNEQQRFVQAIECGGSPLLIEADGGIGKTLGYLVPGMRQAQRKDLPLIVATSNITNRDGIELEYNKIIKYAKHIGDPLGDMPLLNYRSVRDYVSPDRLAAVIARIKKTGASKAVLDELYDIQTRASDPGALLERVMPYDIAEGVETGKIIVQRREIAAHADDRPAAFLEMKEDFNTHVETACVIIMTHAMLASPSRLFRKLISDANVARVVIDEADKLPSMDFVTYASLTITNGPISRGISRGTMTSIEAVLAQAENFDIDTQTVAAIFDQLRGVIADIKAVAPEEQEKNFILIHDQIGEKQTKAMRVLVRSIADALNELADRIDRIPVKSNPSEEAASRWLLHAVEELVSSADRLSDSLNPQNWLMNTTDTRVFLSWDEGDELRVVSGRPGGIIEWLYRDYVTVPVLLTTAFLGEKEEWFSQKIGLPLKRLRITTSIRAPRHGHGNLKFTYYRGLHDAIHEDPDTGIPTVNPAHYDDITRVLRETWDDGMHILVLTPGYRDVGELYDRLAGNLPIFAHLPSVPHASLFPHRRGTTINEIRDRFVQSKEGGIMLTVYWEGYNIVGDGPDRRGLIDVLVMSRIPFQRPNPMLENLHKHFGWYEGLVYRDLKIEAKRRIHQGFNRLIRGPEDKGRVLILDNRFPAPSVLTTRHDEMPRLPRYVGLLDAIPERFRRDPGCFEYVDFNTMEQISDD